MKTKLFRLGCAAVAAILCFAWGQYMRAPDDHIRILAKHELVMQQDGHDITVPQLRVAYDGKREGTVFVDAWVWRDVEVGKRYKGEWVADGQGRLVAVRFDSATR